MSIFGIFKSAVSPKRREFIRRLANKRVAYASDPIKAAMAWEGTPQHTARNMNLGKADLLVSPEATIAEVLEKYWEPHIASHYHAFGPMTFNTYKPDQRATQEEREEILRRRDNDLAGHIEVLITGKSNAAVFLPPFENFIAYLKYRVAAAHPTHPYLDESSGFTDDFFRYAVEESREVFRR